MGKVKYTSDSYADLIKERFAEKITIEKETFGNIRSNVTAFCKKHGVFKSRAYVLIKATHGCPKCHHEKMARDRSFSLDDFISHSNIRHNNKYSYNEVQYVNRDVKITIHCYIHGVFSQTPAAHLAGQGCPDCGAKKASLGRRCSFDEFVIRAKEKYGDKYTYDQLSWKGMHSKTNITCPIHGLRTVIAYDFLTKKYGCEPCSNIAIGNSKKLSLEEFLKRAKEANKNYDYSLLSELLKGLNTIVTIICPDHGPFEKRANKHLLGRGCPQCLISKQSSQAATLWLESLNIPHLLYEYRLPQKPTRCVDGFDPQTNTIYQFHGDYWHGNLLVYNRNDYNKKVDKTMGELFDRTSMLDDEIRSFGYNLIIKWENGPRKLAKINSVVVPPRQ